MFGVRRYSPDEIGIRRITIKGRETGIDTLDYILEDVEGLLIADDDLPSMHKTEWIWGKDIPRLCICPHPAPTPTEGEVAAFSAPA